jgi:dual specificity MAP kinase phosphatase
MYEIIPNLYLASYHSIELLPNTFIVNCTKNLDMLNDDNIRIDVDDDMNDDSINKMYNTLNNIVDIIDEQIINNKNVIVHCLAGQQRSPTVIAAYLISKKEYKLNDAIEYIREKKKDAFFWQINFIKSLEMFNNDFLTKIK